jgi:hypothetical protein
MNYVAQSLAIEMAFIVLTAITVGGFAVTLYFLLVDNEDQKDRS